MYSEVLPVYPAGSLWRIFPSLLTELEKDIYDISHEFIYSTPLATFPLNKSLFIGSLTNYNVSKIPW